MKLQLTGIALACASISMSQTFFATQLNNGQSVLYRFTLNGPIETFQTPLWFGGMTTVPQGLSVGNMNGGATGGSVIGFASTGVYRLDDAFGTNPHFVQIGVTNALAASPFFVGNRFYGAGAALPAGAYLSEMNLNDFSEISREAMGFLGSAGGAVMMPNGKVWFEEHNLDQLREYTIGTGVSTVVSGMPNFDYCGMERYNGVNYTMLGLNPGGSGRWVLGMIDDFGVYSQLRDIDVHNFNGQTGMTIANPVPEPASLIALGLGALTLLRRRRSA